MSILKDGEVDWILFAKTLEIPVIPETGVRKTGRHFWI